jgi:hypothetical protein
MRASPLGARSGVAARSGWNQRNIPAAHTANGIVDVASDMSAVATGLVSDAADATAGAIVDWLGKYKENAENLWPVDSGFSRSQFKIEIRAQSVEFVGTLRNAAFYSGWIKQAGYLPEQTYLRILFNPSGILADRIVADIGNYLADSDG